MELSYGEMQYVFLDCDLIGIMYICLFTSKHLARDAPIQTHSISIYTDLNKLITLEIKIRNVNFVGKIEVSET